MHMSPALLTRGCSPRSGTEREKKSLRGPTGSPITAPALPCPQDLAPRALSMGPRCHLCSPSCPHPSTAKPSSFSTIN